MLFYNASKSVLKASLSKENAWPIFVRVEKMSADSPSLMLKKENSERKYVFIIRNKSTKVMH